jgi:hypothetical protein
MKRNNYSRVLHPTAPSLKATIEVSNGFDGVEIDVDFFPTTKGIRASIRERRPYTLQTLCIRPLEPPKVSNRTWYGVQTRGLDLDQPLDVIERQAIYEYKEMLEM